ncbi:phage tail protein [Lacticaseibacillus rhamnosus]|uniref:phage tail protein n=1 Tax=Lacticaseibacillus rhamnosus TaxID=47715 RepID=UPI00237FB7C6|nr:phage tail protein [Lacticaseibacillus rhamnosus]MDE3295915.1 phage tail protein [Lacticaseibacillus rhamnosus]
MYLVTIKNGNSSIVIHAPDTEKIKLQTGTITKPLNSIPSFEFSMLPNNPGYASMRPKITNVQVVRTDKQELIFDGRVLTPTNAMTDTGALTRTFMCEGVLGYLHDGVPGYLTLAGTWEQIITKALEAFNSTVEDWKRILPGNITTSGNLSLKTSPETNWYDTLQKFIVTDHSYDWRIRTDASGKHFLDVKSQLGETKASPRIELARNIQSMSVEADPVNVISRVIPLGAVKESNDSTSADEIQDRVNLGDIGKPIFVDSPDLIGKFGVNAGTQIFDSVKDAAELEAKGLAYLQAERPVTTKYEITALDLSMIGLDTDDFDSYNYYPVRNSLMGVDEPLRVTSQIIDLTAPQRAGLEIGNRMKRQSDFALDALNATRSVGQLQQTVIGQSSRIVSISKTAQEAQKSIVALQGTVEKLQTDLSSADIASIKQSLGKIDTKLSGLSSDIEELDKEVSEVKGAQKTDTGATLSTLEERIKVLEDYSSTEEGGKG